MTNNSNPDIQLIQWDAMRAAIETARTIDEVKDIRDKAQAMLAYVKQQRESAEVQNSIADIKVRAERRAGELLRESDEIKHGGDRKSKSQTGTLKLEDIGITKQDSHRWQKLAEVPEDIFDAEIEAVKSEGGELTSAHMYRMARDSQRKAANEEKLTVALPTGKYRCIVIDPPWPMKKIDRDTVPNQSVHLDYPTMTLDEITALPIGDLATDDGCHLYLWTTQKFLPVSLEIVAAWGFKYQCLLTWMKPGGFTPFSWMYNTEHVIFARRGSLDLLRHGIKLGFDAPTSGHSVKPDKFYEMVCEASPEPRLEMFARRSRDGFTVWGNEV